MDKNIKKQIISYALDELLHNWNESDFENLTEHSHGMKNLSEDEIKQIIIDILQQH